MEILAVCVQRIIHQANRWHPLPPYYIREEMDNMIARNVCTSVKMMACVRASKAMWGYENDGICEAILQLFFGTKIRGYSSALRSESNSLNKVSRNLFSIGRNAELELEPAPPSTRVVLELECSRKPEPPQNPGRAEFRLVTAASTVQFTRD